MGRILILDPPHPPFILSILTIASHRERPLCLSYSFVALKEYMRVTPFAIASVFDTGSIR